MNEQTNEQINPKDKMNKIRYQNC